MDPTLPDDDLFVRFPRVGSLLAKNSNAQANKRSEIAEQNPKYFPGVGNPLLAALLL